MKPGINETQLHSINTSAAKAAVLALESSVAYDVMQKEEGLFKQAILAFDQKLQAAGVSGDVRLATIAHNLQELSFIAVAGLACCEDDYRKRFERWAEMLRARAFTLAHDTEHYNKVAYAQGMQPVKRCGPATTEKPVIN